MTDCMHAALYESVWWAMHATPGCSGWAMRYPSVSFSGSSVDFEWAVFTPGCECTPQRLQIAAKVNLRQDRSNSFFFLGSLVLLLFIGIATISVVAVATAIIIIVIIISIIIIIIIIGRLILVEAVVVEL